MSLIFLKINGKNVYYYKGHNINKFVVCYLFSFQIH